MNLDTKIENFPKEVSVLFLCQGHRNAISNVDGQDGHKDIAAGMSAVDVRLCIKTFAGV